MAVITKSEAWSQFKLAVAPFIFANDNVISDFLTDEADLRAVLKGDESESLKTAVSLIREKLSDFADPSNLSAVFIPFLVEIMKIAKRTETDPQLMVDQLIKYMISESDTIKSRGITFDTVAAIGSPTGNPTFYRLTEDENGYDIEGTFFDLKKIVCVAPQTDGEATRFNELFEITGEARSFDSLDFYACDKSGAYFFGLQPLSETGGLLENSDLTNIEYDSSTKELDTSVTQPIASWDHNYSTASNFTVLDALISTADDWYFNKNDDNEAPKSLKWAEAGCYIRQYIEFPVNHNAAYFCGVLANRELGTAVGASIKLTWGSKSQIISLGSTTGWIKVVPDLDKDLWPKNWDNGDRPYFEVKLEAITSGYVVICQPQFAQFDLFDAIPIKMWSGDTPPVRDDSWSYQDVLSGADSVIQKAVALATLPNTRHLPSAGSPTIADPT